MIISRQAWHYRYLNRIQYKPYESHNLCGYFWRLFLGLTIPWICGGIIIFFTGLLVYNYALLWIDHFSIAFEGTALVLGFVLGIAAILVIAVALADRSEKHGSILPAYLKAKKDKVCPIITFN